MKKIVLLVLLSTLLYGLVAQPTKKKVVFFIVDGIPTDILYKVYTPNIDAIAKQGSLLESYIGGVKGTYSETPTISANGYATIITGTWGNKHNVWGNKIKAPNYNYPSVFRMLKDKYPSRKIGVYSSWIDNRKKLIGEGLAATKKIKMDYAFDGLELDTINYPHDKQDNYVKKIDTEVALAAAKSLFKDAPDLSWVYLWYTDDVAHRHGESEHFSSALAYADALVGLVYDAVKLRQEMYGEEWLVVVTTDHGRQPLTAKGHGGQSDRERNTWIAINQKVNEYAKNNRVAAVDIVPTINDYLAVDIAEKTKYELDGVSLIKKVDAHRLRVAKVGDLLKIDWSVVNKNEDEKAKILVSYTNNQKNGGEDVYKEVATVRLKEETALVSLKKFRKKKIAKVVLKTPRTVLNVWME